MGPLCSVITNEKEKLHGKCEFLEYGSSSMSNNRRTNEDGVLCGIHQFGQKFSFGCFGVMDGKGRNSAVSAEALVNKCLAELLPTIIKCEKERLGDEEINNKNFLEDYESIVEGHLRVDRNLEIPSEFCDAVVTTNAGCESTTIFAIPRPDDSVEVICSNLGRCMGIFYNTSSDSDNVKVVSTFHTPSLEKERLRITRAREPILEHTRVQSFYFSRCFGHSALKGNTSLDERSQVFISEPDCSRNNLRIDSSDDYSFILLGTEGLFIYENPAKKNDEISVIKKRIDHLCSMIVERLKEQELGLSTYYENEEKRTRRMLNNYDPKEHLNNTLSQPNYTKLTRKKCEDGFCYDLDAIAGELCDYCWYEEKTRENISCVIILLRGKRGKVSRGYHQKKKYMNERVEYVKEDILINDDEKMFKVLIRPERCILIPKCFLVDEVINSIWL